MTGDYLVKAWIISMVMFTLYVAYSSLLIPGGWPMSCFAMVFLMGYPIRNYMLVRNYLNGNYPLEKQLKVAEFRRYLNEL
jgi:hypothetical protein